MNELLNMRQILFHENQQNLDLLKQISKEELIDRSKLAVKGTECIELGYQGKAISEIMNQLIDSILKDELTNEHDDLIHYLKEHKK